MKELKELLEAAKVFGSKFSQIENQCVVMLEKKEKLEEQIESLNEQLKKRREELYCNQVDAQGKAKEIVAKADSYFMERSKAANALNSEVQQSMEMARAFELVLVEREKDLKERERALQAKEKEVAKIKEVLKTYA